MAHFGDHQCEGNECDSKTDVSFCVKENQMLCETCAKEKRHSIISKDDGGESKWLCKEHDGRIKYFCHTHQEIACQSCATIKHQVPCELSDVNSLVREERERFSGFLPKLELSKEKVDQYRKTVDSHSAYAASLLRGIQKYVLESFAEETQKVEEEKWKMDETAKEEVEEKIKELQDQLQDQLQQNEKKATAKYLSIKVEADALLSKLKQSIEEVSVIPKRMREIARCRSQGISEFRERIEMMLQSNPLLLAQRHLATVIEDHVVVNLDCSVLEELDQIVERISFTREGGGRVGELIGTEGSWKLSGTIELGTDIRLPLLVGSANDKEVVVSDIMNRTLHVINLKTKHVTPVMQSSNLGCVSDCTTLDDSTLVCGNFSNGSVCFFNKFWRHRREVRLQDHPTTSGEPVYLDIDPDGRILAILYGQPLIFVVNESEGIVRTITLAHCKTILDIHSLASGDILVQSGINRFTIFDVKFEEKKVLQRAHWETASCTVDKKTNLLYFTFKEFGKESYAIDILSPEGEVFSERCVEFPASHVTDTTPRCQCLSNGKLVLCNGGQLFLFKKILGVKDIRVLDRLSAGSPVPVRFITLDDTESITTDMFV
ncbi:uncharacterized protein LOC105447102 [Strongylocentrotus purpuratus]|uniref:B box-type domain-containing protein n=1 Tax=Strongylocentrotus purpuratus TaxID=7668 RepID=A0A7M7LWP6_STRPU|nr:uncharacterized protein LOC105447102 [Strongylocentrotus purpuratus]